MNVQTSVLPNRTYRLSGRTSCFYTGDAISEPVTSIETPDVYNSMDMDPDLAVETRHQVIALLSQPHGQSFTPHFPWPGLGRVRSNNGLAVWELAAES